MKLERFRILCEQISAHDSIQKTQVALTIYRYHNHEWIDESNAIANDPNLVAHLNYTREHQHEWRPTNSDTAFFPVHDFECVVVAQYPTPPRKKTRERLQKYLGQCATAASNKFDATHDKLTGLMNRSSFEEELIDALQQLGPADQGNVDELTTTEGSSHVLLLSIDIDFFKQVNDLHGHLYGDRVLQAFSRRIERVAKNLEATYNPRIRCYCARPSGEEFFALVTGHLLVSEESDVAEEFRSKISVEPLPSETEWSNLDLSFEGNLESLPPSSERHITASIGYTSRTHTTNMTNSDVAHDMKNEADIALYKAKQSGRNQHIRFQDILHYHGRILEHHKGTNIIAIDIGRSNNVTTGQEFKVYHPDFSGSKPFIFSDGRTHKQLGVYPKVNSGRVEVFDAQSDISFCKVLSNHCGNFFEQDSRLEAVSFGSITHLISESEDTGHFEIPSFTDVQRELEKLYSNSKNPLTIVTNISNSGDLVESRGVATTNRIIARFYDEVRKRSPRGSIVGFLEPSHICIVSSDSEFKTTDIIEDISNAMTDIFGSIIQIHFGYLDFGSNDDKNIYRNISKLSGSYTLHACNIALTSAIERGVLCQSFSSLTLGHALYISRRDNAFDKMEKDYEFACQIEAETASIYNQMALKNLETADFISAKEFIDTALLSSDEHILFLNKAYICALLSDFPVSYDLFHEHFEAAKKPSVYLAPYALAAYRCYEEGSRSIPTDEVRSLLDQAIGKSIHPRLNVARRDFVRMKFSLDK